jgi:hypothetical protein
MHRMNFLIVLLLTGAMDSRLRGNDGLGAAGIG